MSELDMKEVRSLSKSMMKRIVKRLILLIILLLIVFVTTEWIVYNLQMIIFKPNEYITYVNPLISFTKFFAMGIFFSCVGLKYFKLTRGGKVFFIVMLTFSISGLIYSALSFQAANENKIVEFRVHSSSEYSWDEVDHISTHVYREDRKRSVGGARSKPRKVIEEYNIHVDGEIINVWSEFDNIYELHELTSNKNIKFEHKTESEYFDQRFTNYFKDNLNKSYNVFGVN